MFDLADDTKTITEIKNDVKNTESKLSPPFSDPFASFQNNQDNINANWENAFGSQTFDKPDTEKKVSDPFASSGNDPFTSDKANLNDPFGDVKTNQFTADFGDAFN